MPRRATGGIEVDARGAEPTFRLRFQACGKRRFTRLGSPAEGWTRERAEEALRHTLSDVERGLWQPPAPTPEPPAEMPTFHHFASDWLADQAVKGGRRGGGLSDAGKADLEWRLSKHLLRWFAHKRLDEITVRDVDVFTTAKTREGLNATSINKLVETLGAILSVAREWELIPRNVARGKGRKLASVRPRRSWIDRESHLRALLDGASQLDGNANVRRGQRRALLAVLAFAGLRLGECLDLRWTDVDLARGTLKIREGKTAAAARTVNLLPALRDELADYRARLDPQSHELVFGSATGARQSPTNIRRRILTPAVEKANERLEKDKLGPLPDGLTPHSLRRTFASILCALGEHPRYIMGQMGHTDANLTLRVYAKEMERRDGEPERLKALVQGEEMPPTATEAAETTSNGHRAEPANPVNSGLQGA